MNITFMIGNGFDINCGMKCTYQDAYQGYVKIPSPSNTIAMFKGRINKNIETWADFEVAMAHDMVNYRNEQEFTTCLRDFKKYLNLYLANEETRILERLKDGYVHNAVRTEMLKSIASFYDGISHDVSNEIREKLEHEAVNYRVISFNYTSVIETVLNYAITVNADHVIHIHGQLNDDIVLGMDNVEQLPEVNYPISRRGERAFIKTKFNQEYDRRRVSTAEEVIQASDIICVYGMSLGVSDLTWRNLLFQWLHDNPEVHLFIYDYQCSCLSGMTVDERMDNEEEAKYEILNKLGSSREMMDQYLPRLHIPCGKNIFNVEAAIQRGLDTENDINKKKERMRITYASNIT